MRPSDDPWTTWLDALPANGADLTPAGVLLTRLRAAARRGVQRRFTVPGTGGALSVCFESLTADADAAQLALSRLGTVRAVGTEMRWRDIVAQRAVLSCAGARTRGGVLSRSSPRSWSAR